MPVFESLLILLGISVLLLKASRKLGLPYPVVLAFAGGVIATLPFAPHIPIEPHLALAVFITPALFDAAYDTTPHHLRKNWLPLTALAVFAVIITAAVVAFVGVQWAGLPIAAAVTLGAIVAPPDAAAVHAVLQDAKLPKHTFFILKGESLLNDAVALLIFGVASTMAIDIQTGADSSFWPFMIAVPGGAFFGWIWARLYLLVAPSLAQALSSTILEFAMTFGAWVIAEHLHISPILAVVFFAMTVAQFHPVKQSARDRVHSYSIWEATVFILNVIAFLLMGLQARAIILRIERNELVEALAFAGVVLATVILVRLAWILSFSIVVRKLRETRGKSANTAAHSFRTNFLVSWCGIRGLLTIATALALPSNFPSRDLIILTAFSVVVGTLIVQGLTIQPLLKILKIKVEDDDAGKLEEARAALVEAGLKAIEKNEGKIADTVRAEFLLEQEVAKDGKPANAVTEFNKLRLRAIRAQRKVLAKWREQHRIDDDIYHKLEEQLDWSELAAASSEDLELSQT